MISTMVSSEREGERRLGNRKSLLQHPTTLEQYQTLKAENEAIEKVSGYYVHFLFCPHCNTFGACTFLFVCAFII